MRCCRRSWEETSALLADVGLILEYAALLGDKERAQSPDVCHGTCLQHVARLAQRRLADFCELGWPALATQVALFPSSPHLHPKTPRYRTINPDCKPTILPKCRIQKATVLLSQRLGI